MENWLPVVDSNHKVLFNGSNIVVQHVQTSEIGYLENTKENRELLRLEMEEDSVDCFRVSQEDIIETDVLEENEMCEADINGVWEHRKIQMLLTLYLENVEKFRNPKVKKKELWKQIAVKVGLSDISCDKKFRNLKLTYIRLLQQKKKSGRGAVKWKYFDIFEEIFQNDKNINPEKSISKIETLSATTHHVNMSLGNSSSLEVDSSTLPEKNLHTTCFEENNNNIDSNVNALYSSSSGKDDAEETTPKVKKFREVKRSRRNDAFKKLLEDVRTRQVNVEEKLSNLIPLLEEANTIQKERNELFKQYLNERHKNV